MNILEFFYITTTRSFDLEGESASRMVRQDFSILLLLCLSSFAVIAPDLALIPCVDLCPPLSLDNPQASISRVLSLLAPRAIPEVLKK